MLKLHDKQIINILDRSNSAFIGPCLIGFILTPALGLLDHLQ